MNLSRLGAFSEIQQTRRTIASVDAGIFHIVKRFLLTHSSSRISLYIYTREPRPDTPNVTSSGEYTENPRTSLLRVRRMSQTYQNNVSALM